MCACKETNVRESPNDSTFASGEGQGSREEMRYSQYCESPVSSVIEHPLYEINLKSEERLHGKSWKFARQHPVGIIRWILSTDSGGQLLVAPGSQTTTGSIVHPCFHCGSSKELCPLF
jgi:hypothetical protein